MSWFVCRIGLGLLLLFVFVTVRADDPCPTGVKELSKDGGDGAISWKSRAILVHLDDTDWCYDRKVVLHDPKRQYINWPQAGINKQTVENEWTVRHCCYPEPRTKDGELEHGYSARKVPTQVYEGSGEPKNHKTWTSVAGFLYVEGKTVRVDLTFKSSYTYDRDSGFQYLYEIINRGDNLALFWGSSVKSGSWSAAGIKPFEERFKMAKGDRQTFSIPSTKTPQFMIGRLPLFFGDGENEILNIETTAYVPTPVKK